MEIPVQEHGLKMFIDDAVITVFDTMLAMELCPSDIGAHFKPDAEQVIGMVGLAGGVTAVICLRVTETFACRLTEAMMGLGPDASPSGSDVNDVIGELTNISAGKLKSCFRTPGQPCSLSLPTIVRGHAIDMESMRGTERHSFTFYHGEEPVVVEFYSLNPKENPI
jgi:CheY-specific phosphatase CheX